jgi:hypothetical protein
MKNLKATWFTNHSGCVGIVRGKPEVGEDKAYIGIVSGLDEELDKIYVAEFGSPFPIEAAKLLIP